jgi:hypothetical protein
MGKIEEACYGSWQYEPMFLVNLGKWYQALYTNEIEFV